MKRIFLITAVTPLFLAVSFAYADNVHVITKENAVRETCRFLSPVKAKVQYGDELEVVSTEGDWLKVKTGKVRGCIHKSAVNEKKPELSKVSGSGGSVSGDEVSLAGKGFNPEVEKAYKDKHPELDFKAVDSIEAEKVPDESLKKFAKDGGLKEP